MNDLFNKLVIIVGAICIGTRPVVQSDDNFFNDELVSTSNVFPIKTTVNVGETVLIKMLHVLENQKSCLYRRTQTKELVNVLDASGNVEWLPVENCGIRIKNVSSNDEGYWYLTSQSDNDFKRGIAFIEINDKSKSFDLRENYTPLETFSPDNTRYCSVFREDAAISSVLLTYEDFPKFGECQIPNIDLDPESNGVWAVKVGLMGFTDEVNFLVNVNTKPQKLVSGIDKMSSNYAALKCNIENIRETTNITFCRFIRETDKFGLNLEPGGGNSRYSYYGKGFHFGDCGLLITQPSAFDRSIWKCYLGIEEYGQVLRNPRVGAILDLSDNPQALIDLRTESVYGLETKPLDILCQSKTAIEYCWFSHPNGQAYGVSDEIADLDETIGQYWYYGNGFQLGQCGITLAKAELADSGQWKCHVGIYQQSQLEISQDIEVRVTKSNIIAKDQSIGTEVGENIMIECSSIPRNTPLEYCRFHLPNGVGFSIDEEVVSSRPLANRYFFNPNHSLKSGYCSIIVTDVDMEDNGKWLCGAKLLGWTAESMAEIDITVVGDDLSVATVIGISVGAGLLLVLVVAYVIYRKHKKRTTIQDATADTEL